VAAITVKNPLPDTLIALPMEVIDLKDALLERGVAIAVTCVEEAKLADRFIKEANALKTKVEEGRLAFGRDLRSLQEQINAAAAEALQPLSLMIEHVGKQIRAFEIEEQKRIAEERRKADEERARLQAEEDARAAAAAEFAAEPGQPISEVVTPEVMPKHVAAAYVPPAYKSSSVRAKPKKLDVFAPDLVPFEVNGVRLYKELNLAAIKALIAAKIDVPGCRMVDDDGVAMKGAR
jgi:hypothetical protein